MIVEVKQRAFSFLEVVLAGVIVFGIIFFGKRFFDVASESERRVVENKIVDSQLRLLIDQISNDIESIVLLNKSQPIFEVSRGNSDIKIYFFTTSESNVTTAVRYTATNENLGKISIERAILSPKDTLELQGLLGNNSSFENQFEIFQPLNKTFSVELSDFKIRIGVERYPKSIALSPANVRMRYSNGELSYFVKKSSYKIMGDFAFIDTEDYNLILNRNWRCLEIMSKEKKNNKNSQNNNNNNNNSKNNNNQ